MGASDVERGANLSGCETYRNCVGYSAMGAMIIWVCRSTAHFGSEQEQDSEGDAILQRIPTALTNRFDLTPPRKPALCSSLFPTSSRSPSMTDSAHVIRGRHQRKHSLAAYLELSLAVWLAQ